MIKEEQTKTIQIFVLGTLIYLLRYTFSSVKYKMIQAMNIHDNIN